MLGRIMRIAVVAGCCALGLVLLKQRYAAPACRADEATDPLTTELDTEIGQAGLYLLNPHSIGGAIWAKTRHCEVDVAPITDLEELKSAHWTKVLYAATIDRESGKVTVTAEVVGPATPVFAVQPTL